MFKRRRKQEKKHREGEIPVGSFSDIAFLLIIYFLVATTLIKVKSITADLPTSESQNQPQSQTAETPTVYLRGEEVLFGETRVTFEDLKERLAVLDLKNKPAEQRIIMLESTADTPYQIYFQAQAVISAHGGVVAIVEEDEQS